MSGEWVGFLVPVFFVICGAAVGIAAMTLKARQKDRMHRERMFMAEKGLEIPSDLYEQREAKAGNEYRWVIDPIDGFVRFSNPMECCKSVGGVLNIPLRARWNEGIAPLFHLVQRAINLQIDRTGYDKQYRLGVSVWLGLRAASTR